VKLEAGVVGRRQMKGSSMEFEFSAAAFYSQR
jgi:hypothetical protein